MKMTMSSSGVYCIILLFSGNTPFPAAYIVTLSTNIFLLSRALNVVISSIAPRRFEG